MSGELSVCDLTKRIDGRLVLDSINLHAAAGELVCVVGPSGSGKTSLLRCIAGLERAESGRIEVDGQPIPGVGPRRTAMVFQQDTLFPELTVAQNVEFGLRARGTRAEVGAEAISVMLLRLGLSGLEDRYPDELSGGQQRRVALARALVLHPAVLLLDEPLAGLEEGLAAEGLRLIQNTHRRLGLTTLLVTHNLSAALAVADQIVVVRQGRVAQVGRPREIFERPDSLFVAQFMGRAAFLEAEVQEVVKGENGNLALLHLLGADRWLPAHPDLVADSVGAVLVRPHALSASIQPGSAGAWAEPAGAQAVVEEAHYLGDRVEYVVETEHGSAVATGSLDEPLFAVNQLVELTLREERTWVLPAP